MENDDDEEVQEQKEQGTNTINRMSKEDLKQFIFDLCDGKIFSSTQLPEGQTNLLGMIFMPLALGALSSFPKEEIEKIGCVWEYLAKASEMGVNGYPCFFSCRLMHKEDLGIARREAAKELVRRANTEMNLE